MTKVKTVTIDKETIDSVREFNTEIRWQELQEQISSIIGKHIFDSHIHDLDEPWTDEEIAKLDYILCEIDNVINKNRNVKMYIKE